jgi:hypothetical protein
MLKCARLSFQVGIALGLLDSRRSGRPFFAFAIWLSLLAQRTSCEDLGKTRPARCQVGDDAMPLFSLGMDFKEHPQYAYMKLKSIQEAVAKFGRP